MRATVNIAADAERIAANGLRPIGGWPVSLWFVMLSPLLGILFGLLALIVLTD